MTSREFMEVEVILLLAKYGKSSVLRMLADKLKLSDEELEKELRKVISDGSAISKKKKKVATSFSLDTILIGQEHKFELLNQLHARYKNRTFLPELKDVKRIFDRFQKNVPTLKSRVAAEQQLFELLATLDPTVLSKFLNEAVSVGGFSSLGIISDEILGRTKNNSKE